MVLLTGDIVTLNARSAPDSIPTFNWSSNPSHIIGINNTNGRLRVLSDGVGTVRVVSSERSDWNQTTTVEVLNYTELRIIRDQSQITIDSDEIRQLTVIQKPLNRLSDLIWETNNGTIATIGQSGQLTGVNGGITQINIRSLSSPFSTDTILINVIRRPVPPVNITSLLIFNQITLTWTTQLNNNQFEYIIYRNRIGQNREEIGRTTNTFFIDNSINSNTTYQYSIRERRLTNGNLSEFSDTVNISTP